MVRFIRGAVPVMLGLALCAWCVPEGEAIAQQTTGTVSPARKAQAQARFTKAKTLYKQGKYRAAVDELEEARKLDPEGADLVYNLAVVHEKMAEIEKAIEYYKLFVTMTDNADEIARVQGVIQRLEGARTEVVPVPSASAAASSEPEPPPPPATPKEPEKHGRFDGLVIASGVVAAAGLATGIVFGLKAKGDEITGTPTTDASTSYQDLQDRNDRAKKNALFADIGFGVALVGGVTGVLLYFTRTAEPSTEQPSSPSAASRRNVAKAAGWAPSVSLLPGGGAMAGIGGGF